MAVTADCKQYLNDRPSLLGERLAIVNCMAATSELPDGIVTASGLKITPLNAAVRDAAHELINQTSLMLPHVKRAELVFSEAKYARRSSIAIAWNAAHRFTAHRIGRPMRRAHAFVLPS